MEKVVGIRFRGAGKVYHFNAEGFELQLMEKVLVETERGLVIGTVVVLPKSTEEHKGTHPLKPLMRIASEDDISKEEENQKKEIEAKVYCKSCIEKHVLDMNLVDVEYLFDGSKIIFYFTADERVDFRMLVRDLASKFRTRIEMCQIGVRNKAKLIGGIGSCGRELCCNTFMTSFEPVSVKMAKDQNISLNPSKISGVCGRLMCCLKFEYETYLEMKKNMPKVGKRIKTPEGMGKVVRLNILNNTIIVVLDDGGEEKEIPVDSLKDN